MKAIARLRPRAWWRGAAAAISANLPAWRTAIGTASRVAMDTSSRLAGSAHRIILEAGRAGGRLTHAAARELAAATAPAALEPTIENGPAAADTSTTLRTGLFAALVDHTFPCHEYDASGHITKANATFCKLTGYTEAELVGSSHRLLKPDLDRPWTSLHSASATPGLYSGETMMLRKDGSELWLSSTIASIVDENGQVTGYTSVAFDVTDMRQAREELRRHGKLMQLGQLTATVAHEIRNPLGAIRTASFVLERKIKGQVEGVSAQLERINSGIQRCDKIITELLDVSRVKALKRQQIDVDRWIMSAIAEDCQSLTGSPRLEFDMSLGGLEARFDPDQMRQVLINLLSNASEAMAEKARGNDAYRPAIVVSTRLTNGMVEIVVADNGPGIEPKNLKRIREPLFTTKSFGVGLGIPAIERILESHGGYLSISSVYGEGATVIAGFERGDVEGRIAA